MADKRVYRYVRTSGSDYVGMHDEMMGCFFNITPDNSCYQTFLLLSGSDQAIVLEMGDPLPSGTTAADLWPQPTFMPTGSHP